MTCLGFELFNNASVLKGQCLLLLVRTRSVHHARHGSHHVGAWVKINVINYATKYATKMKEKFFLLRPNQV